jgi:origin recognition complex subunit 1
MSLSGLTRITFPGYTHDQLMKIIQSRLEGIPGNIVDPDAVQFASRKVAAVSGDARRVLDICRRAVEIAEQEAQNQDTCAVPTPSKKQKFRGIEPVDKTPRPTGRVMISTIKRAIDEATSTPLQQVLKALPLASKLFLAALIAQVRRTGIAESAIGDILDGAKKLAQMSEESAIRDYLMTNMEPLEKIPCPRILGMGAAAVELAETGIIAVEPRRGERIGKIRLSIAEDELKLALRNDIEVRGLGFN